MPKYIKTLSEILESWDGAAAYEPIVCLQSHSLSHSVGEVSTRTRCDLGGVTQRRAGAYTGELSFSGVYSDPETGKQGFDSIESNLLNLGNNDFKVTTTYSDQSTKVVYYNGFFSSLEKNAELDNDISFSGTLMLSGKPSNTDPHA